MKGGNIEVQVTADTDHLIRNLRTINKLMARPEPIDWFAVALFWLGCIDLGAIAAIAVRALS